MGAVINEIRNRYGRLVVIDRAPDRRGRTHWLCQCNCGQLTSVGGSELRRGATRSCGCLRRESARKNGLKVWRKNFTETIENGRLPEGEHALRSLRGLYRYRARKRGIEFRISLQLFREITSKPCAYCGTGPSLVHTPKRANGSYKYNGVDRKDADLGYVSGNVVPCCDICNRAKSDMNYDDFIDYLDRVAEFRIGVQCG